jgi:hypothetical protein
MLKSSRVSVKERLAEKNKERAVKRLRLAQAVRLVEPRQREQLALRARVAQVKLRLEVARVGRNSS